MIGKLTGFVDGVFDGFIFLDVGGVGYRVFCSTKTAASLPKGESVSLFIETQVREDHIHLFGFSSLSEQEVFNTLTGVQGVGAKVCLSILSVLSPVQLAQAISAQDKASFSRAIGVGPKLAARIVTELKDKIVTLPVVEVARDINNAMGNGEVSPEIETEIYVDKLKARDEDPTKMEDAISALVNLGYQRLEAYKAVNQAVLNNPDVDMATLIRLALKEFANKD
jgi:Holliday junction DNA helicase RuvA